MAFRVAIGCMVILALSACRSSMQGAPSSEGGQGTLGLACGSANGASTATSPSIELCSSGSASEVVENGSSWTWTCTNSSGIVNCSAPASINGACGSASGIAAISAPVANLCSSGTASLVSGTGPFTWTCSGSNGGSDVSCSDQLQTNGACGTANNVAVFNAPTANLCNTGVPSNVSGTGPFNWTCAGTNGGSNASCTAPLEVNGACGSANGVSVSSAPTVNLCASGTASAVSGSGPFSWSCSGVNGGSGSSCSAPLAYTVTPSGLNVLINPTTVQYVSAGNTSTFSISAQSGFLLSAVVGGSCPQGAWNGQTYTTGSIQSSCNIVFYAFPVYPRVWALYNSDITDAVNNDVSFFTNPLRQLLFPLKPVVQAPNSWNTTPWLKYASFANLESDLANNKVPANIIVAYDNENWSYTPCSEWGTTSGASCTLSVPTVIASMIRFANDAHNAKNASGQSLNLKVMFTPAADMFGGGSFTLKYTQYIQSLVAASTAPYADYYELQSQGLEGTLCGQGQPSPITFDQFVTQMVMQILQVNPKVIVLAGTSSNDSGTAATPQCEADAAMACLSIAGCRGVWANDVTSATINGNSIQDQMYNLLLPQNPAP